jgi:hypothetical protein
MIYGDTATADDFIGIDSNYPLAFSGLGASNCPVFQKSVQGSCVNKTCNGKTVLNYSTGKCQKQQSAWSVSGCDDGSSVQWNGLCQDGTAPVAAHIIAAAAAAPSPECATGSGYDAGTQECWPLNPATGLPMVNASTAPQKFVADGSAGGGSSLTKKILIVAAVAVVAGGVYYWWKKHKAQPKKGSRR